MARHVEFLENTLTSKSPRPLNFKGEARGCRLHRDPMWMIEYRVGGTSTQCWNSNKVKFLKNNLQTRLSFWKAVGTGNFTADQVGMWKQGIFTLFMLYVPCSDWASDLPVGYSTMLIARHYLLCWRRHFLFLEKTSASMCLLICVSPVLKLTFKYLRKISGSWRWHCINDYPMLQRKLPWKRVLVFFYTRRHRATIMSRQRVCQRCVLACVYPQLQLSFSHCPHLCRLAVQRPWPVQNLFSQAHV